jgi:hypothetical protein
MFPLTLGGHLNENLFWYNPNSFSGLQYKHPGTNEKARNISKFYEHCAIVLLINTPYYLFAVQTIYSHVLYNVLGLTADVWLTHRVLTPPPLGAMKACRNQLNK